MSNSAKRKFLALVLGGALFQTYNSGGSCAKYYTDIALTSFDYCAVLNCSGGTYFNLCSPVRILIDCPVAANP